jgi:hypothetical protein
MKIYIAGKITGDENYKAKFGKAEIELIRKGHTVFNPAKIPLNPQWTWEDYMSASEKMQKICDAVLFLSDWEDSKGARRERIHACAWGQKIFDSPYDIPDIVSSKRKYSPEKMTVRAKR